MVGPLPMDAFTALKPGAGTVADVLETAQQQQPDVARAVQDVLARAHAALLAVAGGAGSQQVGLAHLAAAELTLLGEVLGEGEVKALIRCEDGSEIRVQESVMPGLWRVLSPGGEWLEVADVPQVVRQAIAALPPGIELPASVPEDAMNVQPVLAELDEACRRFDQAVVEGGRGETVEINLTLLPMTPVDMQLLDHHIGVGPVSIVSLGYGNCRVDACARRHLWTVRFYNTEDTQILNSVQAGDVPVAVRATREDIADSAVRLGEVTHGLFAAG